MLKGNGKKIIMTEGDYGLSLPITINGTTFEPNDNIKLVIKRVANGEEVLSKNYSNIENNTFEFILTEEESKLLTPFDYVYTLDWFRDGKFLCNIIKDGAFQVEDKY